MDKRTAHRWPLLAMIMAGVFLAAGSFWLVQVMNRGDVSLNPDSIGSEPDYIIENFSFVRMTPEGKPRYLLHGAKMTHRPLGDVSEVERPVMKNLAPGAPPMTVTSQRALIRHDEHEVDLLGKVEVSRPGSATTRALKMQTEALTVFTDEDRMQSNRPVRVTLGTATMAGVGMQANNASRQVQVGGRGRIVYPPNAAR